MEKLRNTLNKLLNLLAGLSMTVMVVLTTYQVIVRYIFNSPSTWSEELVGYLFGWSTMLGATIVSGERGHMNIPVLIDRFNPTMRKAFHIFAEVIAFIFSAAILVFGGFQVSKLAMGQQTSSLGVAIPTPWRFLERASSPTRRCGPSEQTVQTTVTMTPSLRM